MPASKQKSKQLEPSIDEQKVRELEPQEIDRQRKLARELSKLRARLETTTPGQLDEALKGIEQELLRGEKLTVGEIEFAEPYILAAKDRGWITEDVLNAYRRNPTPTVGGTIINIVRRKSELGKISVSDVIAPYKKPELMAITRARVALSKGNHTEALNQISQSLDINPANPEAWFIAGLSYEGIGDLENSWRAYSGAVEQGKTNGVKIDKFRSARDKIQRKLGYEPDYVDLLHDVLPGIRGRERAEAPIPGIIGDQLTLAITPEERERLRKKWSEEWEKRRLVRIMREHGIVSEADAERLEESEIPALKGRITRSLNKVVSDAVKKAPEEKRKGDILTAEEQREIETDIREAHDREWIPEEILKRFEKTPTKSLVEAIRAVVSVRREVEAPVRSPYEEREVVRRPVEKPPEPTVVDLVQKALELVSEGKLDDAVRVAGNLLNDKKYGDARRIHQAVLGAIPSEGIASQVWNDMGVAYDGEKNPDEALRCFEEALKINPHYGLALSNKLIILGRQGTPEAQKAIVDCADQALSVDPNDKNFGAICDRIAASYRALDNTDAEMSFRQRQLQIYQDEKHGGKFAEQAKEVERKIAEIPPGAPPSPTNQEFGRKYFGLLSGIIDISKLRSAMDSVESDDARRAGNLLKGVLGDNHATVIGSAFGYNLTGELYGDLVKAYPSITDKGLTEELLMAYLVEVHRRYWG